MPFRIFKKDIWQKKGQPWCMTDCEGLWMKIRPPVTSLTEVCLLMLIAFWCTQRDWLLNFMNHMISSKLLVWDVLWLRIASSKTLLIGQGNCVLMYIETVISIWCKNMLGYLSTDIICFETWTVRSWKTVSSKELIISKDKYPSIVF